MNDIYTEKAWPYLLEKYPRLNDLCMIFGIRTPQGAKTFKDEHKYDAYYPLAQELSTLLYAINFNECFFHEEVIHRAKESYAIGEYGDYQVRLDLLLSDLEQIYKYFKEICDSRHIVIDNTNYDELLNIYKECIILKEGYEDLYIKFFNRRLKEDGYPLIIPDLEITKAKRLTLNNK